MAKIREIDALEWDKWVNTRPKIIQSLCKKFPPDRLYKLKLSNHYLTVVVDYQYNPRIAFPRKVFGIKLEELEECEVPRNE